MNEQELLQIITGGESSTIQLKERLPHPDSFADETEIFDTSIKNLDKWLFSEYFKKEFGISYEDTPVRLLIFDNRIEIISPGRLPNSLTVEEIKYGNPVIRNNQIALFASHTLPYSGLGSGLRRAFANQPDMELENDVDGEQFIVRFPRKETI